MSFTFKEFLAEMHYGSLIDQSKYDGLDSADQALYQYTADGFTHLGHHFEKLAKRYPFEGGVLYRGLHFDDQESYDKFMADFSTEVTYEGTSSWTPNLSTATDFALTEKTYFPTAAIMKAHKEMRDNADHMPGFGGVVLKTTAKSGSGIDVNKSSFAKETEVILGPGTYTISIAKEVVPFKRQFKSVDDFAEVFAKVKKHVKVSDAYDKDLGAIINHIAAKWLSHITAEQADIVASFYYSKAVKAIAEDPAKAITAVKERAFMMSNSLIDKPARLELSVYIPFSKDLVKLCTPKYQAIISKSCKAVMKPLAEKIHELVSSGLDDVAEYRIEGLDELGQFVDTSKITIALKQALAARYHSLNSREMNKKIKSHSDMKAVGELVKNIITAMSKV